MILAQVIYILGLIPLAWYNAYRIKKGLRIYHALNCLYHFPAWAVIGYMFGWEMLAVLPFEGKLFFDMFLNKFRDLPGNYMPLSPRSLMDKVEKWLFRNDGYIAKITYAVLIIALNIYYYGNKEGF